MCPSDTCSVVATAIPSGRWSPAVNPMPAEIRRTSAVLASGVAATTLRSRPRTTMSGTPTEPGSCTKNRTVPMGVR